MNIALEETTEHVDGVLKSNFGDAFIRGNNGTLIQSLRLTQCCILLRLIRKLTALDNVSNSSHEKVSAAQSKYSYTFTFLAPGYRSRITPHHYGAYLHER